MKRIFTFFTLTILFSGSTLAQESSQLIKTIQKEVLEISTDRMGNLYLLEENHIWKYSNQGDSLHEYNSKRYGKIQSIDTSDPYKILVFFQDYAMVLILDNYLSPIGKAVDLNQLGYDQITAVAHSREGGYWLFDRIHQKVYRLNNKWELSHESIKITQWFGNRLIPKEMVEINNKLYINEPDFGLFVFDHFATFMQKITMKSIHHLQVLDNKLYYVSNGEFCQFHLERLSKACKKLSEPNVEQARIEKNRLYTFDGLNTRIYKTN